MEIASKERQIEEAKRAEAALEVIEPYFRAVEAFYTEQLIAVNGSRPWWRGDTRRKDASDRIKALRDVRLAIDRVIVQGKLAIAPRRQTGL